MSHLTDGQLHAYLDGGVEALDGATLVEARSHLAACGDCGARLEAARLVRDEAASLLGRAVPSSFAPPPFQELERRAAHLDAVRGAAGEPTSGRSAARGGGAVGGRRFRRPGSLAWAASLMVALTAGWLARGTVGSGMADRPAVEAPSESIALQGKQEATALDRSVDRDRAESRPGSIAGGEGGASAPPIVRERARATGAALVSQTRREHLSGVATGW
ncbi:MAG: zf-HC2 domain-containing protein [Gemmatimonadales bacterium]